MLVEDWSETLNCRFDSLWRVHELNASVNNVITILLTCDLPCRLISSSMRPHFIVNLTSFHYVFDPGNNESYPGLNELTLHHIHGISDLMCMNWFRGKLIICLVWSGSQMTFVYLNVYQFINPFSAGTVFRRQNLTCNDDRFLRLNPSSPHDALKHHFTSLKTEFFENFQETGLPIHVNFFYFFLSRSPFDDTGSNINTKSLLVA